jgi:hypothetical protein
MKKALITGDARQILGDPEVTMGNVRIGEKQSVSPVLILVVDDSERFRHFITFHVGKERRFADRWRGLRRT